MWAPENTAAPLVPMIFIGVDCWKKRAHLQITIFANKKKVNLFAFVRLYFEKNTIWNAFRHFGTYVFEISFFYFRVSHGVCVS